MAKRFEAKAAIILAAGLLMASPAAAVKTFTVAGGVSFNPTSSISLYGAPRTSDNYTLNNVIKPLGKGREASAVASVPEPTNWILMLVGFGLLGAMTRRANPHPLRDELVH